MSCNNQSSYPLLVKRQRCLRFLYAVKERVCVFIHIFYIFFWESIFWSLFIVCLYIYIYIYIFIVYFHDIKFNVEANLCVSGSTLRDQNALDISRLAESCNAQCGKIWKGRVNLKVCLCCSFFFLVCLKCS